MIKLNVYSAKGVKRGTTNMPRDLLANNNLLLLAQAIRVYEDRSHKGTSKVKTRGQVRASTAKIWRQKGTGRARHGDIAAPIFVGGGVAHGPKGVKRILFLPKKMRQAALKVSLSLKAKEGKLVVADNLGQLSKTKEAKKFLDSIIGTILESELPSKVTVVLSNASKNAVNVFKNIKNLEITFFKNLNAYKVYFGGLVILDKEILTRKGNQSTESNVNRKKEVKKRKVNKTNPAKSVKTKRAVRKNKSKKK